MTTTLISFASWEPRFVKGVTHLMEEGGVNKCVVVYAKEYAAQTAHNRYVLNSEAKKHSIELVEVQISLETSIASWKQLVQELPKYVADNTDVLFDITTYYTYWMRLAAKCSGFIIIQNLTPKIG
jgi:hypothetical protein